MKVTLVAVCHRSSGVLVDCVASFRREAKAAGVDSEVVAVEQSEDERETDTATAAGADQVCVRPNLGYAAGLNAGAAEASGDVLLLANPDIRFLEGSLEAMLTALGVGFDLVGPQLVWDEGGDLYLPIAEDPAPAAELWRTVRRRWQLPWWLGLGRALEQSWRVWTAEGPVSVSCLRGPLLAVSRSGFERFGPLDEGYFLYYEDTEWVWRARRNGARLAVAANAPVIHRWGHATDGRADRARLEEDSRRRFFRRNYRQPWRRLMAWISRGPHRSGVRPRLVAGPDAVPETVADLFVASIYPHLIPAVGWLGRTTPPASFGELADRGRWYCLAASRARGGWRVAASWTWERP